MPGVGITAESASALISKKIAALDDWRGETYKNHVKMTFAKGASLEDPQHLFNSSLDGNVRRAIDIHEGEKIDARALKALFRAAVALNVSRKKVAPRKRGG